MKVLYKTMTRKAPEIVETKDIKEFQEKILISSLNSQR